MNITRMFAHAIVRRIAFVIVAAALAWIGIGKAHAQQDASCDSFEKQCTVAQAYTACMNTITWYSSPPNTPRSNARCVLYPGSNPQTSQLGQWYGAFDGGTFGMTYWAKLCPPGTTWDEPTKKCHDPAECLARLSISDKAISGAASFCDAGCEYKPKNNGDNNPNELNFCMAGTGFCGARTWQATGQACASSPPPKPYDRNKDTCVQLSNGYGECVKPDGTHCWTNSDGKSTCWKPGETGPRTTSDGKMGSDRKVAPGIPSPPSNLTAPEQKGNTTTTINNTTYNTSSYSSSGGDGTPGQGNSGVDGDSDGDGKPDEGGSASGGAGCAAPPSCSGDPIACAAVHQAWLARCGESKSDKNGDGRPDWTELGAGEGSDGVTPDGTEKAKEWDFPGLDMLDDSGFIGASCPAFPTFDLGPLGQFDANTEFWCNWIEILGAVFLFIFAAAALAVLVS